MKKLVLLYAMLFLCLSMTACIEETPDNTESFAEHPTVDNDTANTEAEPNDPVNDTDTESNNVVTDVGAESNNETHQDEAHHVPYSVSFSSIAEINDFLNNAKGNTAQYDKYVQENNINTAITQSYAQSIATNVEQHDIPLVKSNEGVDEFAATYYLDRNELDIIYKINGIRYRFVYKYDQTSMTERTISPILEDISLGTYVVDLYQGNGCFVGEIVADSAVIQIVVYAERANDVALNAFNMGSLSDSKDHHPAVTEASTDELLNEIDQPIIEVPLLTLEFEDAYTEFINSTELPADFVSYDEIAAIGAFRGLVILSDAYTNDYSSYLYTLVDSEGFEISLYVDHNEKILSTANPVSNVNQTDMRLLSDTSRGVYTSNGLTYKYVSGELLSISWKNQNITYTLCASGAPMLSDYPLAESTFVGKMLNLTTIPVSNDQVVIK